MNRDIIKANLVVFIASFCTLVIELVAGRMMAPYVGVSLYTWTSIIGVVLAGISLGAYAGGLVADRYPRYSTLGWLLFLSGMGAFSIPPLMNLLGDVDIHASLMMRIVVLTTAVFFVPSFILGMISPVVVKLTLDNLNRTGNIVGKIYAFSTLGSIIGTFATGFYLIQFMGTRRLLFTVGAILIASSLVFGGVFIKRKRSAVLLLAMIPVVALCFDYGRRPTLEKSTYFFFESDYYTIQLRKLPARFSQGSVVETLVLDRLGHSMNKLDDPFYLEYEYENICEEMVRYTKGRAGEPFRSLFIGGGGYTLPRFFEARYANCENDVVEIDPVVTKVAQTFLGLPKKTKIRTYNEDARWFIMNSKDKGSYDFIFGDAFNDLSVPYHLTTLEFNRMCAELLKPDGIYMVNIIDSIEKGLFLPAFIRTLEEVFGKGKVHLIAIGPELKGTTTCVILASRGDIDFDDFFRVIGEGGKKKIWSHVVSKERLRQYMQERPSFVLTDDYVPVDNLIAAVFEERLGYRKKRKM